MFEKLNEIELQGKKYPIKCDLLVLEEIQNEFDSLNEFEKGLITVEKIEEKKDEIEEALEEELGEGSEEDPVEKLGEELEKVQYKVKFPDMKKVSAALFFMVNEGEEITAELEGMILSILVDTFISKISLPMQPVPEIGSISVA